MNTTEFKPEKESVQMGLKNWHRSYTIFIDEPFDSYLIAEIPVPVQDAIYFTFYERHFLKRKVVADGKCACLGGGGTLSKDQTVRK